jgi:hypothetical protein
LPDAVWENELVALRLMTATIEWAAAAIRVYEEQDTTLVAKAPT